MTLKTPRLGLPLLAAAQAQKEVTHNEALALADVAMQTVVVAVAPAALPDAPALGQCWIVGSGAGGPWAGHDHEIAAWTAGGWRFLATPEGTSAWSLADSMPVRRTAGGWVAGALRGSTLTLGGVQLVGARAGAIANPSGGSTVDVEARATLGVILSSLRTHGLIAT